MDKIGVAYAEIVLDQQKFLTGVRQAEAGFRSGAASITRHANSITSSLTRLIGVAGGLYALKQGIQSVVRSFADFDEALRNVWTLTDKTWDEMQALGDRVRALAPEFGMTATQATKALYQIYSASFQGEDAFKVLEASAKGAVAGVSDLFTAADITTTILNAYSMSAEKATYVNDILFKTVERGKTTYGELASTFGRLVGVAAPLGAGLEELAAAVATLTRQGIKTDEAVTYVRQALMQLADPVEDTANIMKELGYESGAAMVRELGFAEALKQVTDYAKEHNIELTDLFTNVRAVTAVLPLATTQAQAYAHDMQLMAQAAGATETAFGKQASGLSFRLKQVGAAWSEVAITLGETFLPVIEGVTGAIKLLADMIKLIADGFQGLLDVLNKYVTGPVWQLLRWALGIGTGAGTNEVGQALGAQARAQYPERFQPGWGIPGLEDEITPKIREWADKAQSLFESAMEDGTIEGWRKAVDHLKLVLPKDTEEQAKYLYALLQKFEWNYQDIILDMFGWTYESFRDMLAKMMGELEKYTAQVPTLGTGVAGTTQGGPWWGQLGFTAGEPGIEVPITVPSPTGTQADQIAQQFADLMARIEQLIAAGKQRAEKEAAEWQNELEEIAKKVAESPAEVLPAIEQFIAKWKEVDPALMGAVELLSSLKGALEELIAGRRAAGLPTADLEEDLKRVTALLGEAAKTQENVLAKQWETWRQQLQDGSLTVRQLVEAVKQNIIANQNDTEAILYHWQQLKSLQSDYELLASILKELGLSSEDAEAAAKYLASALGMAGDAAQSLADQLRAAAVSQISQIMGDITATVQQLLSGTTPEGQPMKVEDWLEAQSGLMSTISTLENVVDFYEKAQQTGNAFYTQAKGMLKQLYTMIPGIARESWGEAQARRAAEEEERKRAQAAREAEEAARKAQQAAEEAARAAQEAFRESFKLPVKAALATGDWLRAAAVIQEFARQREDIIAQAQALPAVNGQMIDAAEVLQLITGSYRELLSTLGDVIEVMHIAGEDASARFHPL